jgi:hypothetical protein
MIPTPPKNAEVANSTRNRTGSTPKYSPRPPETPASTRLVLLRRRGGRGTGSGDPYGPPGPAAGGGGTGGTSPGGGIEPGGVGPGGLELGGVGPGGVGPGGVGPGGGVESGERGLSGGVEPGGVAVESGTVVIRPTMRSRGLSGHPARP